MKSQQAERGIHMNEAVDESVLTGQMSNDNGPREGDEIVSE